jgi:hypothetical protein
MNAGVKNGTVQMSDTLDSSSISIVTLKPR